MDIVPHAEIYIAGPPQCLELFMMDWRATLAWSNYCEGGIIAVAMADLIWTIVAFGAV